MATCFVDKMNIRSVFGLDVVEGSYASLIQWPSLKGVDVVNWQEENGTEPDLSTTALDSRECNVTFAGTTSRANVANFLTQLSDGAYHELILDINRTYILRLVNAPQVRWVGGMCIIRLRFADDFPLRDYVYLAPSSTIMSNAKYLLDDVSLSTYGVYILDGTQDTFDKRYNVKPNLERSYKAVSGVEYDAETVKYGAYDASLKCLMRASTLDELWCNYDALLYNISQPGVHKITASELRKAYPCYYESGYVRRFYATNKIWLEFDIKINIFGVPYAVTSTAE